MDRVVKLLLITFVCLPMTVVNADERTKDVLSRALEVLHGIHTARYEMEVRDFRSSTDSIPSKYGLNRLVECENPADTLGLSMYLRFNNGGKLHRSYNGENTFYERFGYIEKRIPSSYHGVKFIQPPFFNHVTRLCEYLLEPNDKVTMTLEDCGDEWLVKAVVREWQQVCFYGKPHICSSMAYAESHFGLRIDKSTMIPSWISFLDSWPQIRHEWTLGKVEINPMEVSDFSFVDYLPDLPVYDGEEAVAKGHEYIKSNQQKVMSNPLPCDTLQLAEGGIVSFAEMKDKVKVLLFTGEHCGVCPYSYPVINKIYDEYHNDSVEVYGILYDYSTPVRAVESYAKKHDIHFPLVRNNGHFYEYFFPNGLAPAILVIGRNDEIILWQNGFDTSNPDKIEKRIRKALLKVMSPEIDSHS